MKNFLFLRASVDDVLKGVKNSFSFLNIRFMIQIEIVDTM